MADVFAYLEGFGASGGEGGTLKVNAPPLVAVTITNKAGKTKTKTANADGMVIFKGLASGKWNVTIVNSDGKPTTITADVQTEYTVTIAFFSATIDITYPAGSTCTCSDGTTTLSAPDASGTWVCTVPNAGTWTVSSTDGDKSKGTDVVITTDGQTESVTLQYITYLFKDGETYNSLTGGWKGHVNAEKKALLLAPAAGKRASAYTKNKVDLTNFSTVSVKTDSNPYIGLSIIIASAIPSGQVATASLSNAETELSLDISSITGEYFIWLSAYSEKGASRNVYEVSMQ